MTQKNVAIFLDYKIFFLFAIVCLFSYDRCDNIENVSFNNRKAIISWLNWESWSKYCERNCSQKTGKQFRQRECVSCTESECFKVEKVLCSLSDNQYNETQFCYQGIYIYT